MVIQCLSFLIKANSIGLILKTLIQINKSEIVRKVEFSKFNTLKQ